jgi:hypothetical protein
MDFIAFKGMMFWRVQLAGVCYGQYCRLWHDPSVFFAGYGGERLVAMLIFGSCITFVLSVDMPSLARISADAVAIWVALAAVEKVGRVPGHTFQGCCKNVIMQTGTGSVWYDERND